jgi:hypothetical protein
MTTPASLRSDYRIVAIAMAPEHPIACTPEYPSSWSEYAICALGLILNMLLSIDDKLRKLLDHFKGRE